MEDEPTQGGFGTPSDADVSHMIRTTAESWNPGRGPDWPDLVERLAKDGPPPWLICTAASATLIFILFSAFLVGSVMQLGALAPQPIPAGLH